jgi:PmbA protein
VDRILKEAQKRADAAEIFGVIGRHVTVRFENDKLKGVDNSEAAGVGLRVVADEKIGFSSTTLLDEPERIAADAAEVARFGEPATFEFAKPNGAPDVKGLFDPAVPDVGLDDMIAMGRRIVDTVKAGVPDAKVGARIIKAEYETTVANSNGLSGSYKKTFFAAGAMATLVEGDNILEWWDGRSELSAFDEIEPFATDLVETLRIARNTTSLDGAEMAVIFAPDALSDIFCTLEAGLDGEQVAKGMSPLVGKIGERLLDERITLVDDGTAEGMGSSAPFDDEGTPHVRLPLFERGVLRSYVTNLKYAKALGI